MLKEASFIYFFPVWTIYVDFTMNLCDDLEKDEVQVMLYHLNFEGFKNNETWFEDFYETLN